MSCVNVGVCPSASGWCVAPEAAPRAECVEFILAAYEHLRESAVEAAKEEEPEVLYLCDRRACLECHEMNCCAHTHDVTHAENFRVESGAFVEKRPVERGLSWFVPVPGPGSGVCCTAGGEPDGRDSGE